MIGACVFVFESSANLWNMCLHWLERSNIESLSESGFQRHKFANKPNSFQYWLLFSNPISFL